MPLSTVSSSRAAAEHGRLDPAFHLLLHAHGARMAQLGAAMTKAQAAEAVNRFPDTVIARACETLAAGRAKKAAADYPYLALALIEQAVPAEIQRLEQAALAADQARERLEQIGQTVFGALPKSRRPGPGS